ncbi:MAG: chromate efflux transporter [Bacteriovorax sp.]|nr:chromate efflux transporter [Bacteriovorax sp.]
MPDNADDKIVKYKEVFFYFLRLGALGFGGPLAIVGSIQKDLVENRNWMNEEDFNATFSLIKAMPGPVAFQTAVFMGRVRAGFLGGAIAGFCLVVPAFCLMILFSLFFKSMNELAFTRSLLQGMQVAALGVILGSLKGLVKNNMKEFFFWVLVIIAGLINFYHPSIEPIIIIGFGLLIVAFKQWQRNSHNQLTLMSVAAPVIFFSSTVRDLALVCFKAGALVFGTGLAIVPMLQHDVVVKYQWLSQSEFLDALAFGQMTPGPVVITATYIGHKLAGMPGAIIATVAIFAAAFFHMSTWFPLVVTRLRGKKWINDFVFGAVAAVVGPIIVTVLKMGYDIPFNFFLMSLAIIVFIFTLTNKVPLWLLIPLGGVLNLIFIKLI